MLCLSCSRWDLQPLLWQAASLVMACELRCGMWDLFPWPGIELEPPALGAWRLSDWTSREVPHSQFLMVVKMPILGTGWTEVKAPFSQYQKSITGKAIHMITLVLLKWEGVIISRNTSLGCTRETVSHFRDMWCYWRGEVGKWQSKQS